MIKCDSGHTCDGIKQHSDCLGKAGVSICGKPAVWTNGKKYYCQHHSRKGRFIFRNGDTGEIKARFDTKEELIANVHLFPGLRPQHLSKSRRHDILIPQSQ